MARCLAGRAPGAATRHLRDAAAAVWPQRLPHGDATSWDRFTLFAAASTTGAVALAMLPPPARCYYEQRPDGSVDRLTRWSARSWSKPFGESPAFHTKGVNSALERHWPELAKNAAAGGAEGAVPTVLVPLCGKSYDLVFLCEQGFGVVGVEGVQRAVVEFRDEQRTHVKGLQRGAAFGLGKDGWAEGPAFEPAAAFQGSRGGRVFKLGPGGLGYYSDSPAVWRGRVHLGKRATRPLELIQGDMFDVTPALVAASTSVEGGQFDIIYDRRSLETVPAHARAEYVSVLSALLKREGQVLMVCVEFDESLLPAEQQGFPPYSISRSEVQRLFPGEAWRVEELGEQLQAEVPGPAPGSPGSRVMEATFRITRRHPVAGSRSSIWDASRCVGGAVLGALGLGATLFFCRG